MYTNRAYETSSELDDISADSANSGNNRVAPVEKDYSESLPVVSHVVSKHNQKQSKSYVIKRKIVPSSRQQSRHVTKW
mgnify:CR=1 FL=1